MGCPFKDFDFEGGGPRGRSDELALDGCSSIGPRLHNQQIIQLSAATSHGKRQGCITIRLEEIEVCPVNLVILLVVDHAVADWNRQVKATCSLLDA
jgi:hypothetical protein